MNKEINSLHRRAMEIAETALIEQFGANPDKAKKLFKEAYQLEKKAALSIQAISESEPSRSILLRSAASLALNIDDLREAEKLITLALAGEPPDEIAEELRDLYEQVNFHRHLKLKGVELESNEMQLAIAGPEIGLGIAKGEEFIKRVEIMEKLTYRTAMRMIGQPYRDKGPVDKKIKELFEPYISIPRAASFAVTIRFGRQKSLFPEFANASGIIDEIMDDIELINTQQEKKLKEKIKDEAYFRHFVAFTKKLAPDGKNVNLVGLSVLRDGKEKKVALRRQKKEILPGKISEKEPEEKKITVEITGTLSYADALKKKIKLTDEKGKTSYEVIVPEGLGDIVKLHWEEVVIISGSQVGKKAVILENIEKAE